jgi:hypothetical protein
METANRSTIIIADAALTQAMTVPVLPQRKAQARIRAAKKRYSPVDFRPSGLALPHKS